MSFLILLGVLNGLVLLPVILTFIGPKAEIKVLGGHNELPPSSPSSIQRYQKCNKKSIGKAVVSVLNLYFKRKHQK